MRNPTLTSTPIDCARGRARVALACIVGGLVAAVLLLVGGHMDALNAAGAFKGGEIAELAKFFDVLKGYVVWIGGAGMTLAFAVIGLLFAAGHSRARDHFVQTLVGLAILASVTGIVA